MIISVVAAKIWYLKKCTVFIGPPCIYIYIFYVATIIGELKMNNIMKC